MEGQAVKEISDLAQKTMTIEIDGETYARADFKRVFFQPRPDTMHGLTLTGLMEYIKANVDEIDFQTCMIHVQDYNSVRLVSKACGHDCERNIFYSAMADKSLPVFPFGEYLSIEEFAIKARALFDFTPDLDTIISLASKVTAQDQLTVQDNGISQAVEIRRGVSGALTDGVITNGAYTLRPMRTFREIAPVDGIYIFRLKSTGADSLPKVALFDGEGGTWKHDTMLAVSEWVNDRLKEQGIPKIPVIA